MSSLFSELCHRILFCLRSLGGEVSDSEAQSEGAVGGFMSHNFALRLTTRSQRPGDDPAPSRERRPGASQLAQSPFCLWGCSVNRHARVNLADHSYRV